MFLSLTERDSLKRWIKITKLQKTYHPYNYLSRWDKEIAKGFKSKKAEKIKDSNKNSINLEKGCFCY